MNNLTLNSNAFNRDYRFVPTQSAPQHAMRVQLDLPQDEEFSTTAKAVGVAGLLRLAQYGLEKLSGVCSAALMAGKEFAPREDVEKVANTMKKEKGLSAYIHYIDHKNKVGLQNMFPNLSKSLDVVADGRNAFYTNQGNFVVAPKSKPSLILHELGHAINFEKSSVMRGLQKLRVVGMFAPMAIAALNNASGARRDGKKNFWERNAGTIGFCAFLPTIIEEAAASIRGINAAKKTLGSNANLKVLKKNYFLAWMTYLLAGIGTGIAAKLAITDVPDVKINI